MLSVGVIIEEGESKGVAAVAAGSPFFFMVRETASALALRQFLPPQSVQ
jgi:hypothetical protein